MPGYVHHIQWSVQDLQRCVEYLTLQWGSMVVARREGEVVIKAGTTTFLISQKKSDNEGHIGEEDYPRIKCCPSKKCLHGDSVFNICLEVDSVEDTCMVMEEKGSTVFTRPRIINSDQGPVTYALVSSPCDNIVHALVNTQQYRGQFLPGFVEETRAEQDSVGLTYMDHITYVCRVGESKDILDWYRDTCGMARFIISQEEGEEGTVIDGDVGIRLKVGEWMSEWLCREVGGQTAHTDQERNFKLVLAEPLHHAGDDHVNKFLSSHPGPGVQHIGLCTEVMERCVADLTGRGVEFRHPPPAYYTMGARETQFEAAGLQAEECERLGILIDREQEEEEMPGFLLQIFTKPVFEVDTFFMEIIQRKGATGFGAGNIKALALSIIEMQKRVAMIA